MSKLKIAAAFNVPQRLVPMTEQFIGCMQTLAKSDIPLMEAAACALVLTLREQQPEDVENLSGQDIQDFICACMSTFAGIEDEAEKADKQAAANNADNLNNKTKVVLN
jgi:hypothetical protein